MTARRAGLAGRDSSHSVFLFPLDPMDKLMRKYLLLIPVLGALGLVGSAVDILSAQQVPPPPGAVPAPPGVQQPAGKGLAPPARQRHKTGARSSRHHWLAHEATGQPKFKFFAPRVAPLQYWPPAIPTPAQLSYWGNDTYGDCVTAEEMAAKYVYPIFFSSTGTPVDISTAAAESWAKQNGYLNGADLTTVMDSMASPGIAWNGVTYTDGPYTSVDYTQWPVLTAAIAQGPVKLGMAAGQLQGVVEDSNGWVLAGARQDNNEDHCIGAWGYGTVTQLCLALGVTVPSGVSGTDNAILIFTWDTVGMIDYTDGSFANIVGEAWLRSPTTPQTPPPSPTPTPVPVPTGLTWTLTDGPVGSTLDQSGNFSWAVPSSQPSGSITITFTVGSGTSVPTSGSFAITVSTSPAPVPSTVVIAPIPAQSASAASTISLSLSQYVTVSKGSISPPLPGKGTPGLLLPVEPQVPQQVPMKRGLRLFRRAG
jgi:hypothetical protein